MSVSAQSEISADFPFESKFIEIGGSRMHYVDEGKGDPALFLHGTPTSSYVWRNIIPHLTPHARCIAPDLVGFGKSDKPDIGYRFFDHVRYVEGFIKTLALRNVTLVIQDWGSALGLHYASRNEENVRGLAMMESILKPVRWDEFPPDFKRGFKMFRTRGVGYVMIVVLNASVKKVLPGTIVRDLDDEEKRRYAEPFPTLKSRKPIRVLPQEVPVDGEPADVHRAISEYSEWLQGSKLPKLLFVANPGVIIRKDGLEWAKAHLKNLKIVDIGDGIHYVQEDNPHLIGSELVSWYATLGGEAASKPEPIQGT